VDRRNDWNLAARDKRIEMCGYQIDGGRIGSICYNGRRGRAFIAGPAAVSGPNNCDISNFI
jgi:hypothetical protein